MSDRLVAGDDELEPSTEMPWWRLGLCLLNIIVGSFTVGVAPTIGNPAIAVGAFLVGAFSWILGVHRLRKWRFGDGFAMFGGDA